MSEPTMRCATCGAVEVVKRDGRGFPPDIAKRRLIKRCDKAGKPVTCDPQYRAGIAPELIALARLAVRDTTGNEET